MKIFKEKSLKMNIETTRALMKVLDWMCDAMRIARKHNEDVFFEKITENGRKTYLESTTVEKMSVQAVLEWLKDAKNLSTEIRYKK